MQKTFVLGVGAQKSGTTWLHQYLASQPNADLGFAKEYHIWDAIHTPECRRHKVVLSDLLKSRKCRRRWLMQARSFYYFSYFSSLLGRPGVTITADITPAYSSLDGAVFDTIQAGFAQREVACKVVFLMRDPVERCLSAVAHELQKRRLPEKSDYTRDIREYVISKPCEIRTNYARTAQNIESTFAESNIFYGLYEEMFEEVELRRISAFLGVSPNIEFRRMKFNVSPALSFDQEVRKFVAGKYEHVYEFAARLGHCGRASIIFDVEWA